MAAGCFGAEGDADPAVVDDELRHLLVAELRRLRDLLVDDVQLAIAGQNAGEMATVRRAGRAGIEKSLGGERDAPGGGKRDLFLHSADSDGLLNRGSDG